MKDLRKIVNYIRKPYKILIYFAERNIIYMKDDLFLKLLYRARIGKKLNLENPQTFNEKLQWLKLNDRNDVYTTLVDKYKVKKYVSDCIGEEYIIPTLGIYNKFDEIDFSKLPEKFVLKCTHDSGSTIICKNKEMFDLANAKKKIKKLQSQNYYYKGREWPYKNVKPRIILEKYMHNEQDNELKDYKFMCFNGKVRCIFVCSERNTKEGLKIDFFDLEWNKMPFTRHYPNSTHFINKPKNLEKMIQLAEKLAKNMPFVRVDFYEINERIYFGELTFYPGSGFEEFEPEKYDKILGDMIELPQK